MSIDQLTTAEGYYAPDLRHRAVGRYLFKREWNFIHDNLRHMPAGSRVLEIACGSGRITDSLHNLGLNVVGIDLSFVSLQHLQRRLGAVGILQARVPALPFAAGSFDTIVACECLDYFDHRAFFAECCRLLRRDGRLIFDALNRHSYKWYLKGLAGRRLDLPSSELSYRQIIAAVQDAGFVVANIRGYNWQPFFRDSDSSLVALAGGVEQLLQLGHWYQVSPKLLIAAVKEHAGGSDAL